MRCAARERNVCHRAMPDRVSHVVLGKPFSKNGNEVMWQFLWLMTLGIAISYASYLFFGSIIMAGAEGKQAEIAAIDVIKPGEHHVSGVVLVPSQCHELSVTAYKLSETAYQLVFKTWPEPARDCARGAVTKPFKTVIFAPSFGLSFSAILDDEPVSLSLIPHY